VTASANRTLEGLHVRTNMARDAMDPIARTTRRNTTREHRTTDRLSVPFSVRATLRLEAVFTPADIVAGGSITVAEPLCRAMPRG
jgi:hypothetical protein